MDCVCRNCKHGLETGPDSRRPPQGTVWCSKRKIAMGQNRNMTCFIPMMTEKSRRCRDCRRSKMLKPSGEAPELGNVWCEKRHLETNKLRTMECFEK